MPKKHKAEKYAKDQNLLLYELNCIMNKQEEIPLDFCTKKSKLGNGGFKHATINKFFKWLRDNLHDIGVEQFYDRAFKEVDEWYGEKTKKRESENSA